MSKNPNYTGGERFNKLSKKDGYRSRAAYKLKQINKSHNLIKQNQNILDIGCAPGSWIQVVKELTQGKASITGIDILSMAKIEGITFLQKDLLEVNDDDLNDHYDLVLSDIAPNITGVSTIDQENFMIVAENILDFCKVYLKYGGKMAMKFFNGYKLSELKDSLTDVFDEVSVYKPDSSRQKSREVYLVCVDYKHQ